jgi:hypothetical protein
VSDDDDVDDGGKRRSSFSLQEDVPQLNDSEGYVDETRREDLLNSLWRDAGFGSTSSHANISQIDRKPLVSKHPHKDVDGLSRHSSQQDSSDITRKGVLKTSQDFSRSDRSTARRVQFDVPDDTGNRWYFGRVAEWVVRRASTAVSKPFKVSDPLILLFHRYFCNLYILLG